MNLREGRIGRQETICVLTMALCVSGLFNIDSNDAYATGNSTFISVPIALIISLGVFLFVSFAIKRSGTRDLITMLQYGAGKPIGNIVLIVFALMLMLFAAIPLTRFFDMMHNLYFVESNFFSLSAYVLPVIIVFGWLGFETIGRTSKIFAFLVLAVHAALLIYAGKSYDTLNLAPVLGDGLAHTADYSLTGSIFFLPALLSALCLTKGIQGIDNTRNAGVFSVVVGFIVCLVTQTIIGLVYPYNELADIYTPIFNLNSISIDSNPMTRLDIITLFVWLLGAISAASFYTYSASYVYARAFEQRDIRPTVFALATITVSLIISSHLGEFSLSTVLVPLRRFGIYILAIPVVIISIIALIRAHIASKRDKVKEAAQ